MCCIFGYAIRIYIFTALIFIQLIPHYVVIILMQRALDCNYVPRTNNLRFMFGYVAYFYRSKCINLTEIRFPIGFISPAPDRFLPYRDHFTSVPPGKPSKYTWYIKRTEQFPKDVQDNLYYWIHGRKKRKVLLQTTPQLDQIVFKKQKISKNPPVRPILNFGNDLVPQEPKFIKKRSTTPSQSQTRENFQEISNNTLEKLMEEFMMEIDDNGTIPKFLEDQLSELVFNSTRKIYQNLKFNRKSTTSSQPKTRISKSFQEISNDTLKKLMEEILMEGGGTIPKVLDDELAELILNLTGKFPKFSKKNTTPSYPRVYEGFQNIPNDKLDKLMEELLMEESENIPNFLEKMIHSSGNKKEIPLFPMISRNFPTKHYLVHLTHNYGRTGYIDPELETKSTISDYEETLQDNRRIFITKNFGKYHDFRKRIQISSGPTTKSKEVDKRIFITKHFGKFDFKKRPKISTEASTNDDARRKLLEKDRRIFITKGYGKNFDSGKRTQISTDTTTYVDARRKYLEKDNRIFITKDFEKYDQERSTVVPEEHKMPKGLARPKVPFKFPTRGLNITSDQELLKHILGNLKNLDTDFWDEDKIEFVLGIMDPINWILYFLAMMTNELPPNALVTMLTQDPYVRWPAWVIFDSTVPPKSRHKIKEGRRNITDKPKIEGHNYDLRQWITYRGREWPEWWDNHTTQGWIKIQEVEPTAIMWPKESPQIGWVTDWVTIWLLMDLLWGIVTCVLLGGAIGRVRGASSIFTYSPFILVTFCIILMDLACAAFFAMSIPNCSNFWKYLTFVGVRNVGQLKDPEKVWFPDYKNSFADAPWFLTFFFLRGMVFWIINVIIFFKVVHIFRRVLAKTCNVKEVLHRIMVRRRTRVPCVVTSKPQSNWSSAMVLPAQIVKPPTPTPNVSQVIVPRSSGDICRPPTPTICRPPTPTICRPPTPTICRPPTPTICCRPCSRRICYRPCFPPCYGRSEEDEKEDEPCTPATCPNYRPPCPRPPTPPICYRPCTPPPCYRKPSEDDEPCTPATCPNYRSTECCTPSTCSKYRPRTPPNPCPYPGITTRPVCQPCPPREICQPCPPREIYQPCPPREICQPCPPRGICQPCPPRGICRPKKPSICKKCKAPKNKVPSTPDCCTPSTCSQYRPPTPPNPCPYPGGSQQYVCRPCPEPPHKPTSAPDCCIPSTCPKCRAPTPPKPCPYPGGSQQYVCRPCPQPPPQPCPPNPCFGSQPCPPQGFGSQYFGGAQQCAPIGASRSYTPSSTQSAGLFPRKSVLSGRECVNLTDVNFPPGFIAPGPDRYVYYDEYNTLTPEGSPSRMSWQIKGYGWLDHYKKKYQNWSPPNQDNPNQSDPNNTEPNVTEPDDDINNFTLQFYDGKIRKHLGIFPMLNLLFSSEKPDVTKIMTFTKKDFLNARSKNYFNWNFDPYKLQTTSPKPRTLWKRLAEWKLNKINKAFPIVLKKYQRKDKRFVLFTLDKNLIKTRSEVYGSTTSPLENPQFNLRDQISLNLKFTQEPDLFQKTSVEGSLSIRAPTLTHQLPKPTFGQKFIKLLNKYTQPVPSPTYQKTGDLSGKKVISEFEPLTTISNLMESLISPTQKRLAFTMAVIGNFSPENQNGTGMSSKSSESLTEGSSSEFLRTPNKFIKLLNKFRQLPEIVVSRKVTSNETYQTESSRAFQTQLYSTTEQMTVVTKFPGKFLKSTTKKAVVVSSAFRKTKSKIDQEKIKSYSVEHHGTEKFSQSYEASGSTKEFSLAPNKFIKLLNKFTQELPVVPISIFIGSAIKKATFTPTTVSIGPTRVTQNFKFVQLLNKFTKEVWKPVARISDIFGTTGKLTQNFKFVTLGSTGKSIQNFKFVKLINKFTKIKSTPKGPAIKISPVIDKKSVTEVAIKNQSHPTKDRSFVLETDVDASKGPQPQGILKKPHGKPKDTERKFVKLLNKFTQRVLPKKTLLPILNLTGVTNLSMEIKKIRAKVKDLKKYHGKLSKKKFAKLLKKFTQEISAGVFTRYSIPNQTEVLSNFTGSIPPKPRKGKKYRGKPKDTKRKFAKLLKKFTQQLLVGRGKFSIPDSSGGAIGTPSGSTRSLKKVHGKRKPAKKMFVKLLKKVTRDLAIRGNGTYPKNLTRKHISRFPDSGLRNGSTRRGRSKNPKKIFVKLLKQLTEAPIFTSQNFTGVSKSVSRKPKKSKKGGKKSRGKLKNPRKVFAKMLKKYTEKYHITFDDSTDYVDNTVLIPVHLIPNRTEAPKFLAKPLIPFLISSRFKKHLNKSESHYLMNHILHYSKHLNPDFWDEEKIDMLLGLISPINWIVLCLNFMYGETRNSSLVNIYTKAPFVLWPSWATMPRPPRQFPPPEEYTMRDWWTYKGRTFPYWWKHLTTERWAAQQKLMPYHIMWPKFSPNYIWVRDWVIAWLIMDLLWAITTGLMMFGVICRVNGPFSTFFYSPFLLVTFFIIIMDIVCAGYFGVTIIMSLDFWDYLAFAGVRNVAQLKNSNQAWFPDYKHSYSHASWLITIFFLRFGIFWIINVVILWTIIYVFRDVLARKTIVTEVRILNPCDPKFKGSDDSDSEEEEETDDDSDND